jgi:hypothetical protein
VVLLPAIFARAGLFQWQAWVKSHDGARAGACLSLRGKTGLHFSVRKALGPDPAFVVDGTRLAHTTVHVTITTAGTWEDDGWHRHM